MKAFHEMQKQIAESAVTPNAEVAAETKVADIVERFSLSADDAATAENLVKSDLKRLRENRLKIQEIEVISSIPPKRE